MLLDEHMEGEINLPYRVRESFLGRSNVWLKLKGEEGIIWGEGKGRNERLHK
jgi:hypothetical protein